MKPICYAIASAVLLASAQLCAAPFAGNDDVYGAGRVTIDPTQGLEFMDLDQTTGRSYAQMTGEFGAGGAFEGWRHATADEVENLINTFGFSPPVDLGAGVYTFPVPVITQSPVLELFELLGTTQNTGVFELETIGMVAGGTQSVMVQSPTFNGTGEIQVSGQIFNSHWLVRPIQPGDYVTYQGELTDGGAPITGQVDLRIRLLDVDGTEVAVNNQTAVDVDDGLFKTQLIFDGDDISKQDAKIELSVRSPSGSANPFVALSPVQLVAPAPRAFSADRALVAELAFHATSAGSASTATTAATAASADALSNEQSEQINLSARFGSYGNGYLVPTVSRQGNTVTLNGLVGDTTFTNNVGSVVGVLPTQYRPSGRLIFAQFGSGGIYRIDLLTTGEIKLGSLGAGGAYPLSWISLDGISYTMD